jgi:predicted HD superfamily hydrolase involved in NAD metabolism
VTIESFVALAAQVRGDIGQAHRYAHTVRVARLADRLAQRHGEDPRRARLAGMLHDLARLYSPKRLLDECAARGLAIDEFGRRNPIVLHASLGAELARERYGVNDPAVLDAIRGHTLARSGMSRLDAVVYLADALEPGRPFADREALERLAFRDLESAMAAVLRSSLAHLQGKGLQPAPQTLAALRYYERFEKESAFCLN